MKEHINKVANLIVNSKTIAIFTGAGVSTESGIPDFRSPGGLWDKYDPNDFLYQKFLASEESREKYWKMNSELYYMLIAATPNNAHYSIVDLHKMGKLDCVITQNIDNLHQKAGLPNEKVIELHGTNFYVNCLHCKKRYSREEIQKRLEKGVKVPNCDACGGILKPATISFGQPMPFEETNEAERRSRLSDLFIVIGSSLVVHPAALMPLYATEGGAKLVIINMDSTPYDRNAYLILHGKASALMEKILDRVKDKIG
ncbi:MAG: Sir2 family NAD-dependent protein deacetylase [Thermodesulfobacteriota bacterium]|nr:Sir2 family NAD-dependent protein deacetylase [Thermodesulfobacteriota bacterium]